jgi:hypothetical protein
MEFLEVSGLLPDHGEISLNDLSLPVSSFECISIYYAHIQDKFAMFMMGDMTCNAIT